ncbi:hypothetical protein LTR66_012307 [Elasticomyces elasticus]|nr:hypothetical protein LTR66_012307 [Elasticomyces elasticus]KAK4991202.1 hypothetical protein LTR50_001960 [Elasticomyces elasticus]
MTAMTKSLHWTQRVALVRHNLHTASRSLDFTFFKTLQAHGLLESANHIALLTEELGEEADAMLSTLDNLNAGIAYVHQDAFKNVYDGIKGFLADEDADRSGGKAKVYVDAILQKQMADLAIDKMTSSAIALIQQQPEHCQDATANVWMTGATIIADAMEISLREMNSLEQNIDDFVRLEDSWNTVKASVGCAVSALKGIFNLMAVEDREHERTARGSGSFVSATGGLFRRLSSALSQNNNNNNPSPSARSRSDSNTSSYSYRPRQSSNSSSFSLHRTAVNATQFRTPNYIRGSISQACPTSMPPAPHPFNRQLSAIPPTPAFEELRDPFDMSELLVEPVTPVAQEVM